MDKKTLAASFSKLEMEEIGVGLGLRIIYEVGHVSTRKIR